MPIELKLNFERKAENEITRKYSSFEQKNNENRDAFSVCISRVLFSNKANV